MHAQYKNPDYFQTNILRCLTIFFLLCCSFTKSFKMPEILEEFNMTSHLKYKEVRRVCSDRDNFCRSKDYKVCTMRYFNGKVEHKEFPNACFLFLCNMCDNPVNEYHIVRSSSCNEYFNSRRSSDGTPVNVSEITYENKTDDKTDNVTESNEKLNLRQRAVKTFTPDPRYPESGLAHDGHKCPYMCPDFYDPRCVVANRMYGGVHVRFMVFINHCQLDMHYCGHWKDFEPPPPISSEEPDDLDVRVSELSWSLCGSSRYLSFARFTEVASSMGHYGWLAGDYKAAHIMEPHQRMPGYG